MDNTFLTENGFEDSSQTLGDIITFLQNQPSLPDTNIILQEHPSRKFKDIDNVTVARFIITFQVNLSNEENLLRMQNWLDSNFTNDKAALKFSKLIQTGKQIQYLLSRTNLDNLKDINTLSDVYNILDNQISLQDLGSYFLSNSINKNELSEIKQGIVSVRFHLVYKKISIAYAKEALEKEIRFYELFHEHGIETFCAFSHIIPANNGFLDITLFEEITNLDVDEKLFMQSNLLYQALLEKIFYMHSKFLLHGDLHFKNVAYTRRNREIVILFDLVRASDDSNSKGKFLLHLRAELVILTNTILNTVRKTPNLTQEDKKYIIDTNNNYLSKLEQFLNENDIMGEIFEQIKGYFLYIEHFLNSKVS